MMTIDRNRMAELHEQYLAELLGGRKSRNSGATWQDKADGRNSRMTTAFAFAWDGKSTRGKGIDVTRAMLANLREDAGGERPMLGLRFYDTDDLTEVGEEWVAMPAADFAELLAEARSAVHVMGEATVPEYVPQLIPEHVPMPPPPPPATGLHGTYPQDLPVPPHELWPCLIVDARHMGQALVSQGYFVNDNGQVSQYDITSVRTEPYSAAEEHLVVNDQRIHRGQLFVDRELKMTVGGPRR